MHKGKKCNFNVRYDIYGPKNSINGPAKWYYTKNTHNREILVRQSTPFSGTGENMDTTKAILKNVNVRKGAIIKYEFRASGTGVVGCIFKFVDNNNFYTFEIGGSYNTASRFFQIRRKLRGDWTTIKIIGTNAEISYLPFFGYEVNTWYSVEIVLSGDKILASVALMGLTQRMKVIAASDNAISIGRIGFSTYGTEAVFGEISVIPAPIPISIFII